MKLSELPEDFRRRIKEEQRRQRAHAIAVVDACKHGDAERFFHLIYPYDGHPDFWPPAVRSIARVISEVTPEIQEAFRQVWIETKMLSNGVDNRALCRALRILMPRYNGEALRLFRGASALERRRAAYGISWTSNLSMAEQFAEDYCAWPGGSVVLETLASPEAIICAVEYPPPMTEAEKAELRLPPDTKITEYHAESEYLIERRLLGSVQVLRRYQQPT
jgi:hypothetical protein